MEPILSERKTVTPDHGVSELRTSARPRPGTLEQPSRKRTRIGPTVSWYGKILVIGALLITFGWELFHLIIALVTLD